MSPFQFVTLGGGFRNSLTDIQIQELRQEKAGPQLCGAMRVWQSRPVLARLRRGMELMRGRTLPQGLLGQAIDDALKRWEALTRFVDDGVWEIDNNLIENAIRPSALGKKNWLFVGHPEAGERSAVIYTLLDSCRRHGVNAAPLKLQCREAQRQG